jgi:hypothetical protein
VFLEAAAFASTDTVSGVTENIMLGKLAPVGTAAFDLVCPASALGGSLGASASDVQQFIPKSKKVNALFYDKQQQQAVSEKRKPAVLNLTTTGPMTVAAMDMDDSDEHDDQDDLDDLESVAARDVAMSDAQQFKEEEMRSLEDELCGYMPSSPVWLAMTPDYVPTSPKYY